MGKRLKSVIKKKGLKPVRCQESEMMTKILSLVNKIMKTTDNNDSFLIFR
jgi:hypothetical protein